MAPKQLRFAEEYALDHNGAAAAVRAGYAPKAARQTASELLTKPNIRSLVAQHEAEAAERLAVTRERVLAELQATIALAREQGNPMAQIAGWREIAKICGYYAPECKQIELQRDATPIHIQLEAMSDAQLLELCRHDVGRDGTIPAQAVTALHSTTPIHRRFASNP